MIYRKSRKLSNGMGGKPKGNGLYADNVWLKGKFVLMTGEDIQTRVEITEGKILSDVASLRKEIR